MAALNPPLSPPLNSARLSAPSSYQSPPGGPTQASDPLGGGEMKRRRGAAPPLPPTRDTCTRSSGAGRYHRERSGGGPSGSGVRARGGVDYWPAAFMVSFELKMSEPRAGSENIIRKGEKPKGRSDGTLPSSLWSSPLVTSRGGLSAQPRTFLERGGGGEGGCRHLPV